jgi:hypothetical protein
VAAYFPAIEKEEGEMKRVYTVYRVDYVTGTKEAIGCILERRKKDRGNNLTSLLMGTRRLFARGPSDVINIVLDSPKNSREIREAGFAWGIVSIRSRT